MLFVRNSCDSNEVPWRVPSAFRRVVPAESGNWGQADEVRATDRFYRRGGAPGPFFRIFGLREPRGSVRLVFGCRFLRAARFSLLRSARSLIFCVFMKGHPIS